MRGRSQRHKRHATTVPPMRYLMTVIKVSSGVFAEDMPAIKNKIIIMHELTLCQSAFDIIEQQAKANNVKRVTGVWLEIGALSCIEESAVHFVLTSFAAAAWPKAANCTSPPSLHRRGAGTVVSQSPYLRMTPDAHTARAIICAWTVATACKSNKSKSNSFRERIYVYYLRLRGWRTAY